MDQRKSLTDRNWSERRNGVREVQDRIIQNQISRDLESIHGSIGAIEVHVQKGARIEIHVSGKIIGINDRDGCSSRNNFRQTSEGDGARPRDRQTTGKIVGPENVFEPVRVRVPVPVGVMAAPPASVPVPVPLSVSDSPAASQRICTRAPIGDSDSPAAGQRARAARETAYPNPS
jgi:hypothetical protein